MTEIGGKNDFIYKSGRVGIGIDNPTSTLTVKGSFSLKNTSIGNSISLFASSDGNTYLNNAGGADNSRLGIQFDGSSSFSFYKNGNLISHKGSIGIGVTPQSKLDVYTGTVAQTAEKANIMVIRGGNSPQTNDNRMVGLSLTLDHSGNVHSPNQKSVGIFAQSTSSWSNRVDMLFYTRDYEGTQPYSERMRISGNGNVGIGTTNTSDFKLSVKGKIRAEEVKVYTGWADYVFEEDYELKSLSEVEAHIKEHKHLPDVPSAKEVEENGVNVGETEAMLLRKIEELTLYTIEQEKKIEDLTRSLDKVESQEKLIQQLLERISKLEE
ncbi:tail fiber protein [Flammeovirga sp. EKP202]|uniref:tail fiber protein n=1 Tax=Flammeovirga sp. EKP202 TaxID=2770592 RepID=UPI00165FA1DE|nr:tail fiber protein [Flammeovirga sp. EKP202]MBD0404601.1 hypothetical protein [Flammeovirga sp. EKP202]